MKFLTQTGNPIYAYTIQQKRQISDTIVTSGTLKPPSPPRDLFFQPGSRGGLLTWKLPVNNADISGYRIYKDTETTLYEEVQDRGRRQEFVELTATPENPLTITAIARAANVVTVTANNTYIVGNSVTIAGVTDTSFNGTFTVKSASATQFTYAQTGSDGSSSSGTASAAPVTNLFVSCLNAAGMESQKVQIQAQSINEASAPSIPGTPPGYNDENSGGGDQRFRGGRNLQNELQTA